MQRLKVSDNFFLDEFVPPVIYNRYGERSMQFIDPVIIEVAQFVREFFAAPVTVNNWIVGGRYQWSGFRTPNCRIGAKYSQHKFGRAIDVKIKGANYESLRNEIRTYYHKFEESGLTTIEQGTSTWLHLDCRFTGLDELYEVPFFYKS